MTLSPLLFDTHAWLWIISGDKHVSPKLITQIEQAREDNLLHLSAISLWEIAMLAKKARITLDQPTLPWLKNALKVSNVHVVPLTPEITVESAELPNFHGDPADRLIVATARLMNSMVVTRDEKILEYGSEKRVHTLKI